MMRIATFAALACSAFLLAPGAADAGTKKKPVYVEQDASVEHRASKAYRRPPQVRGYVQRRGGYSYGVADTINTYGDSVSIFGGGNSFRYFQGDRQTQGGPFDSGFFFDSGVGPRGGNAPYQN